MTSVLKWLIASLLVYTTFLLIKLPATQVLSRVNLPNDIQFSGVSGTIWNGHAQQVRIRGLPIDQVSWQLAVLPLLSATVHVSLEGGSVRNIDEIAIKGEIWLSKDHLQAQGLQLYLPTDLVITSLPLPIAVNAGGRFKLALEQLDYPKYCQALTGKGQWLNAQVQGAEQPIILGNFDADLSCEDQQIMLTVNQPNSFGLSAVAKIPADMMFSINGRFKLAPELPEEVHQAAQLFGQPDAQGYYSIQF